MDYAVVGAGISGLAFSWEIINKSPSATLTIFEKSRGCGGRLATRRIGSAIFDHGCQYIVESAPIEKWIQIWRQNGACAELKSNSKKHIFGVGGATKLAKALALNQKIHYEHKVISIEKYNKMWLLKLDSGESYLAKKVILTSPLPQSLEILKNSAIPYELKLGTFVYTKALVFLIELFGEPNPHDPLGDFAIKESLKGDVLYAILQKNKGVSPDAALSLAMAREWSERYFNLPDKEIIHKANEFISENKTKVEIRDIHLKKWRYALPIGTLEFDLNKNKYFYEPQDDLFLIGDSFGEEGPGVERAICSASHLAKII
jgi:predicted NAD/FAD-dependent oxidoreductase